ncbi:MAG: pitrilysin family protein [Phycisphaerales bacterium]
MPESATADGIRTVRLACGMPLILERTENVRSAAVCWLLPVGVASDPEGAAGDGHSVLLADLVLRGAGGMSSREFSDALDRLGVQRSVSAGGVHMQVSATLLGDRLSAALPLIVSLVRAPSLPEEHLEAVRSLAIQSLDSLKDEPQQRVMLAVRERHLPAPFNRSGLGDRTALETATIAQLRAAWESRCRPNGSILAIAGNIDADRAAAELDRLLTGWSGATDEPKEQRAAVGGVGHEETDSAQTHVGIAYKAPPDGDPDATLFRLAARVLGSDSSSRLFTEVREKRGLCYSVGATYTGGRDRGMLSVYAGSTPERAQDTVDCIEGEVERFERGVTPDEFARAVVGYKSRLVMGSESTAARAALGAGDWYRLCRVRTLTELAEEVDRVTLERLNEYIAATFTTAWRATRSAATIGPKHLQFR